MKNFLLMVSLCFISAISYGKTYYVSPSGSNSNPGTLASPFLTLSKLNSVMVAGDIAYIRGGTYQSIAGNNADVHFNISGLTGTALNPIKILAYPGELPLFTASAIIPTTSNYPTLFRVENCMYVQIKGFKLTHLRQVTTGNGVSYGFQILNSDYCKIEQIDVSNIGGVGFVVSTSSHNVILNCDSHHNGDGLDTGYGAWNTGDGFACTGGDYSTGNIYDGCRAYINSDDGWDFFAWAGDSVAIKNCWSFWNGIKPWGLTNTEVNPAQMTPEDYNVIKGYSGYQVGGWAGEGFKLGGFNVGGGYPNNGDPNALRKFLSNCVGFENTGTGFTANMEAQYSHKMQFLNCTSYGNGNDGIGFGTGRSVGIAQIFKNCWSWDNNRYEAGADWVYDGLPDNISNNYWNTTYGGVNYGNLKSAVNITATDFLSVSSAGVTGARQADGSLPNLNFLKLVTNSDVIDKGTNVGLPYANAAPDLGAFEKGAGVVPVSLVNFSAMAKPNKTTLLQWRTATEINSDYFVIERSTDGVNFTQMAVANANGNSNSIVNYELTDYYPNTGLNYYRLKIVDNDQQYAYSNIISVAFKNTVNGTVVIISTIAENERLAVKVSSTETQPANYAVYSADGKMIFSSNIMLQNGENSINKNIPMANGVYYFKIATANEKITIPVVKRN